MSIGQVQTQHPPRYGYTRPPLLNKYYKPEDKSQSSLSTDACIPSTETCPDDLSQDLLKEYLLKNQILSAQVQEYKTLVKHLQTTIQQLSQDNIKLRQTGGSQISRGNVNANKNANQSMRVKLPLALITEQSQASEVVELRDLWSIIRGSQHTKIDYSILDKETVLEELGSTLERGREAQTFMEGVRELWARVEQQDSYQQIGQGQLWNWLVKVATNYKDILSYKNYLTRTPPIHQRTRPVF